MAFPFSNLSSTKLRPAIVLADSGRDDWVLCQITSNPYADTRAVEITDRDFAGGGLKRVSYARPGKLFTASASLMVRQGASLKPDSFREVRRAVVKLIEGEPRDTPERGPTAGTEP